MNLRPCALALALVAFFAAGKIYGQGLGLPNQTRDRPIEIHADNGIEWQQEAQAYIARGNARAQQGNVTIHADQLTAYYEKGDGESTQIWRIDADKNVRIKTSQQTAYGNKGIYQVGKGVFTLTGSPRLVTPTDEITAKESIEFHEAKSLAVARGDAVAIRADKRIRADILTAYEYDERCRTQGKPPLSAGVRLISSRPPSGQGIIRPRSRGNKGKCKNSAT